MSDENQIDPNSPVTPEEVKNWVSELSPSDRSELRRLQIQQAAIAQAAPKPELNLGAMDHAQFEAYKRSIGL
jgi:hypothetical protein